MHSDFAESHFKLCFGPFGIGCVQNPNPDITKVNTEVAQHNSGVTLK